MSSRTILLAFVLLGCSASPTDPIALSTQIAISPKAALVQVSQSQSFAAFFVDSTGRRLGPATVKWSSSLPIIASIGQTGTATGTLSGATTIRAIATNGAADSAVLVVIPSLAAGNRMRGLP